MLDHADTILLFAADGHPKYIEQNKIDGNSFQYRRGAQIQYCEEIESWIFTHPDIETENECEWLFRSDQVDPETDFDVIAAAREPWTAWVGEAVFNAGVSIKCTTCVEDSDCSYRGNCKLFRFTYVLLDACKWRYCPSLRCELICALIYEQVSRDVVSVILVEVVIFVNLSSHVMR